MTEALPAPVDFGAFTMWLLGRCVPASQIPALQVQPCPFCGAPADRLRVTGSHPTIWVEYSIFCSAKDNQCGCVLTGVNLQALIERWNHRAVVGDDQKILAAAKANRIWLSAMSYTVKNLEARDELGLTVLEMLDQPHNLTTLCQDSPIEAEREIHRLTPVLFLQIVRS